MLGVKYDIVDFEIFEVYRKNKWALPPGALERHFGPICDILALFDLWRQM